MTNFAEIYFEKIATQGVKRELQSYLYQHILCLSAGKVANLRSGELLSYFTNDINSVYALTGASLINWIRLPFMYIAVLVYLIQINWMLCLITMLVAPCAITWRCSFWFAIKEKWS